MPAFDYPAAPLLRRHGPSGYESYESYRDWLRDEFSFRCVYCLYREMWGRGRYGFAFDHFVPQVVDAAAALSYENLVYSCSMCNRLKSGRGFLPQLETVAYGDCLHVDAAGKITAKNDAGKRLILIFRLDNSEHTGARARMIRVLAALSVQDPTLYKQMLGFPEVLPNLRLKQATNNTKPEGIEQSWFEKRVRGELPETY